MRRCPSGKLISGVLLALLAFSAEAAPLKLLGLDDMSCLAWANTKDNRDERQPYLAWLAASSAATTTPISVNR